MVNIHITHKFASIEDAQSIVNSLIEHISYTYIKHELFRLRLIGASEIKSRSVETAATEITKKIGYREPIFLFYT